MELAGHAVGESVTSNNFLICALLRLCVTFHRRFQGDALDTKCRQRPACFRPSSPTFNHTPELDWLPAG